MVFRYFQIVFYWFYVSMLLIWWFVTYSKNRRSNSLSCLVGKTAIVTGGNGGIGFAVSALLASRGCRVIIADVLDATEAQKRLIRMTNNYNIKTIQFDLSSLHSVRSFAENIKKNEKKIDILVHNAGIGALNKYETDDGLNPVMAVNYFSAFLLTHLLVDPLKASKSARIIFTTSGLTLFQTLSSRNLNSKGSMNALHTLTTYANSKFCCEIASKEFARRLDKYNITVNVADPGLGQTKIASETLQIMEKGILSSLLQTLFKVAARDVFDAAQTTLHLASSEELKHKTGEKYFQCERYPHSPRMRDQEYYDKIWLETERLVRLTSEEKL